jgi:hypothetical protein
MCSTLQHSPSACEHTWSSVAQAFIYLQTKNVFGRISGSHCVEYEDIIFSMLRRLVLLS